MSLVSAIGKVVPFPLRFHLRLLTGSFGLLLFLEPGPSCAFFFPALLSRLLATSPCSDALPAEARSLLALRLRPLVGFIHLGDERLAPGHQLLPADKRATAATVRITGHTQSNRQCRVIQ